MSASSLVGASPAVGVLPVATPRPSQLSSPHRPARWDPPCQEGGEGANTLIRCSCPIPNPAMLKEVAEVQPCVHPLPWKAPDYNIVKLTWAITKHHCDFFLSANSQ
ncbi:uncharacterized protein [Triticum aestivum]|uniref:uncharacterized protein isoform X1 n=1 Tax=Triticum aestivum TaxID=4565 RepID=UPI001D007099|nr:uncharacterized protein LOC123149184 isoform X1 [Triticum aestivum]